MTESDWKKYSARLHEWRDRYLDRRNRAFVQSLQRSGKTPSERFWETRSQVEGEAKVLRDCFDRHSRSSMKMSLVLMLRYGIVEWEDLRDFSDECQEDLRRAVAAFD